MLVENKDLKKLLKITQKKFSLNLQKEAFKKAFCCFAQKLLFVNTEDANQVEICHCRQPFD